MNEEREQRLSEVICFLWDLLDTVDTADDMAKSNDVVYRRIAHRAQHRRWETKITTDGYVLDLTDAQVPDGYRPHLGSVVFKEPPVIEPLNSDANPGA